MHKFLFSTSATLLAAIIMLSAGVRAFTASSSRAAVAASVVARRGASFQQPSSRLFLSTTSDGPDTSIVDICTEKISKALESDQVKVTGAYDDPNGSHISIEVVSDKFSGKRAVQRQQLVYKAIWEELQGPVHAVDNMICKTPDEA